MYLRLKQQTKKNGAIYIYLWYTAEQSGHVSVPGVKANINSSLSGHNSQTNP